jgi:excisionase family DNA binding protein
MSVIDLAERRPQLRAFERPRRYFYSVAEVATDVGTSRDKIRALIRSGCIQAVRFGTEYRIPDAEYRRILREGAPQPSAPQPEFATP